MLYVVLYVIMKSGRMVQCTIQYGRPKAMYSIGYARGRQITTFLMNFMFGEKFRKFMELFNM